MNTAFVSETNFSVEAAQATEIVVCRDHRSYGAALVSADDQW